jgi:hypothetical protein
MNKVSVKKLSPAPQDVFFQDYQFDDDLSGTDPGTYLRGSFSQGKSKHHPSYGNAVKKGRLKKAEKALVGHENKDEILKILRSE